MKRNTTIAEEVKSLQKDVMDLKSNQFNSGAAGMVVYSTVLKNGASNYYSGSLPWSSPPDYSFYTLDVKVKVTTKNQKQPILKMLVETWVDTIDDEHKLPLYSMFIIGTLLVGEVDGVTFFGIIKEDLSVIEEPYTSGWLFSYQNSGSADRTVYIKITVYGTDEVKEWNVTATTN